MAALISVRKVSPLYAVDDRGTADQAGVKPRGCRSDPQPIIIGGLPGSSGQACPGSQDRLPD